MIHKQTQLTIYLIRHAESEMNQTPDLIAGRSAESPLSSKGEEQATLLGKHLSKQGVAFDVIYSSPLVRSRMTTDIALAAMGIHSDAAVEAPALMEFTQGDWEGMPRKEIYTPDMLQYINTKGALFTPPNGESQLMVEHRVSSWFIEEILHNPKYLDKSSTIAIFSHGLSIKCFLHFVMNFDERLTYRIRLDNTAVCKLRFTHEGWFIDAINDLSHLDFH